MLNISLKTRKKKFFENLKVMKTSIKQLEEIKKYDLDTDKSLLFGQYLHGVICSIVAIKQPEG